MTTVPSVRTARYALKKGKVIGSGAYRRVYKSKRGKWVYKVDKTDVYGNHGNTEEYATYQLLKTRQLPPGVKIPEMHMLPNGVLAAEYIDGVQPKNWCSPDYHGSNCSERYSPDEACWARSFVNSPIYFADLHNGNVVVKDGVVYVIDLGHGAVVV